MIFLFQLLRKHCLLLVIQAILYMSSFIFSGLHFLDPTHMASPMLYLFFLCYGCLPITPVPWMWQILNALLVFTVSATFSYKGLSPALFQTVPISPSLWKYFLPNKLFFHSIATWILTWFWNISPHFQLAISLHSLLKLSNIPVLTPALFPDLLFLWSD